MSDESHQVEELAPQTPSTSKERNAAWLEALKKARPRRLLRALLAAPIVVGLLATRPSYVLMRWAHLDESASVALLLVVMAAALWVTEAISLYVTSFLILFLELAWLSPVMVEQGLKVEPATFTAPFFSNVILLFLGGFALCGLACGAEC